MMTLEELTQLLSTEGKEQLETLIKSATKEKKKIWKPEIGKVFYYLSNLGAVNNATYEETAHDLTLASEGNVFESEEKAEFEYQRRKFLTTYEQLSLDAGEADNEWNNKNFHYMCFCESDGILRYGAYTGTKDMNIYFPTEESCRNAVATIGEDNFKKYILRIE